MTEMPSPLVPSGELKTQTKGIRPSFLSVPQASHGVSAALAYPTHASRALLVQWPGEQKAGCAGVSGDPK